MTAAPPLISCRFGRFELRLEERQLFADGVAVHVTPHALDLLGVLLERAGHLVTKDQLLARVWPQLVVEDNTLQVHISALRKVLGPDAIATVMRSGYRFLPEVVPIYAGSTAELPERKHNLPHELTSFIGREKEVAQVKVLLTSHRLLTFTGSGGCGKTRLALRVAAETVTAFGDGCWLVELAPLTDANLVVRTLARAVAVEEQHGRDLLEDIAQRLESRHLLLVLDNAEHLLGECADLAEKLLKRCARLCIIATSRERLGVPGELTFRVPSLAILNSPGDATNAEILSCESARLFVDRARLHRPDLALATEDFEPLRTICTRLDGIALAIELAAPRVRTMSIGELSKQLDDRFTVLAGGARTALPRHRTLRSLIDWSHDLLSAADKTMLRRCSVFVGGCTTETAQVVCAGDGIARSEVLERLTSLTDKSLLVAETRGDVARFRMLETVRYYAQDHLRQTGEEEAVRWRLIGYLVDQARALDVSTSDADRQVRLGSLDGELDNIRAALAMCEEGFEFASHGLRFATLLFWFWSTRGLLTEGRGWIARFLATVPSGEEEDLAQGLMAAGALAQRQTDLAAAKAYFHESLAIRRRIGPRMKVGILVGNLGAIAHARDEAQARPLIEEALLIAREVDDRRSIAWALQALGVLSRDTGDLQGAEALLEEAVASRREWGRWSAARALIDLGNVRHALGKHPAARAALTEALESKREFGDKQGIAEALTWLGMLSHDEGDAVEAEALLVEALRILHGIDDPGWLAVALEAYAGLAMEFAGPIEAARLWGRAQSLHEETGSPQGAFERARCARHVAEARSALPDDAAFERAWSEGRSSSVETVLWRVFEADDKAIAGP